MQSTASRAAVHPPPRSKPCQHFLSTTGCALGSLCPMVHVTAGVYGAAAEQPRQEDHHLLVSSTATSTSFSKPRAAPSNDPFSTFAIPYSGELTILWLWRGNTFDCSSQPLSWYSVEAALARQLEDAFVASCGQGTVNLGSCMIVSFNDMSIRTASDSGNRRPIQRVLVRDVPEWVLVDGRNLVMPCGALASHGLECEYARGEAHVLCVLIGEKWVRVNFLSMTATRGKGEGEGGRLRIVRHPITVHRGSDPSDPYKHPLLRRQVVLFDDFPLSKHQGSAVPLGAAAVAMDPIQAGEAPLALRSTLLRSNLNSTPLPGESSRASKPWCPSAVCSARHDALHMHNFRHRCTVHPSCTDFATSDPARHTVHFQLFEHGDRGGTTSFASAPLSSPRARHGVLKVFRTFWEDAPAVAACKGTCLGTVVDHSKEYMEFLKPLLFIRDQASTTTTSSLDGQADRGEDAVFLWPQRVQNAQHVQKYVRLRNDICRAFPRAEQVLFSIARRKALYDVFSGDLQCPMWFAESLDHAKAAAQGDQPSAVNDDAVVLVVVAVTGNVATVPSADEARGLVAPPMPPVAPDDSPAGVVREGASLLHSVRDEQSGRIWIYDPLQWNVMYIIPVQE